MQAVASWIEVKRESVFVVCACLGALLQRHCLLVVLQ